MGTHDRGDHQQADATASQQKVWTCPMHPEVRSEQPGRCPKCRMFLVEAK